VKTLPAWSCGLCARNAEPGLVHGNGRRMHATDNARYVDS
jgi:hypothetical protein